MASPIQELLNKILAATYGVEVRDAIHDSIKQCYDDVESGTTLAQTAAEEAQTAANNANLKATLAEEKATAAQEAAEAAQAAAEAAKSASGDITVSNDSLSELITSTREAKEACEEQTRSMTKLAIQVEGLKTETDQARAAAIEAANWANAARSGVETNLEKANIKLASFDSASSTMSITLSSVSTAINNANEATTSANQAANSANTAARAANEAAERANKTDSAYTAQRADQAASAATAASEAAQEAAEKATYAAEHCGTFEIKNKTLYLKNPG